MSDHKCKLTEDELISGLKTRSEEAFRCLYTQCFHFCKNFVLANGGLEEDAKDFFQESILVLLDEAILNKFLNNKNARVSTFLITIFRFKWLNQRRAKKKVIIVDIEDTLKDHISEELESILEEPIIDYKKIYKECMKTIGEICQKVILMTFIERKSDQEIATVFGWELGYVKVRRFRCMRDLRNCANNH